MIAYMLPTLSVYFLWSPITVLQGMYAKYFGMSLTTIATVILIARLFDAISDPLIGHYSDWYFSRYGSRKPFIAIGGVLFVISSWYLFVPIDINNLEANGSVNTYYFLVWFLIFYLAYTIFEVPHLAWGAELSGNSQEKNKIYSFRTLGVIGGSLMFFSVPLMPFFETNEFTPQTLKWSVLVAGCLMALFLCLCIMKVPSSENTGGISSRKENMSRQSDYDLLRSSILGNGPLIWFLVAFLFAGAGIGMWFSLVFLFADVYLGLGEKFAVIYVVCFSISAFTLSGWYRLASFISKQSVWILGMLLIVFGIIGTGQLSPGDSTHLELLVCMTLIYSGFTAMSVMAPSLLADIIDYGTWRFGTDRGATYFSLYTLFTKINIALGGALALAIAGWTGFDATSNFQSDNAIFGLRIAIAWLPAAIIFLSILFVPLIKINGSRHAIIRRRLDSVLHKRRVTFS